jgi:hypothetical protein
VRERVVSLVRFFATKEMNISMTSKK